LVEKIKPIQGIIDERLEDAKKSQRRVMISESGVALKKTLDLNYHMVIVSAVGRIQPRNFNKTAYPVIKDSA